MWIIKRKHLRQKNEYKRLFLLPSKTSNWPFFLFLLKKWIFATRLCQNVSFFSSATILCSIHGNKQKMAEKYTQQTVKLQKLRKRWIYAIRSKVQANSHARGRKNFCTCADVTFVYTFFVIECIHYSIYYKKKKFFSFKLKKCIVYTFWIVSNITRATTKINIWCCCCRCRK